MPTTAVSPESGSRATDALHRLTGRDDAVFHDGQLEAITALVDERRRALVVQRTGWGKSAVYFIATALLRERGAGPTLLVSPLIALMRDQVAAAERAGVRAVSISSANAHEWDDVLARLAADDVDVLLVSPERLTNPRFRDEQLPALRERIGLLVVDEAHCISDWGHDFRPDYRRLADLIDSMPDGVPVLATTATANERVVTDVAEQLGAPGEATESGGGAGPGAAGGSTVLTLRGSLAPRTTPRSGSCLSTSRIASWAPLAAIAPPIAAPKSWSSAGGLSRHDPCSSRRSYASSIVVSSVRQPARSSQRRTPRAGARRPARRR